MGIASLAGCSAESDPDTDTNSSPPAIVIEEIITGNLKLKPREEGKIKARIKNVGGKAGEVTITLSIGSKVYSDIDAEFEPGEEKTVVFPIDGSLISTGKHDYMVSLPEDNASSTLEITSNKQSLSEDIDAILNSHTEYDEVAELDVKGSSKEGFTIEAHTDYMIVGLFEDSPSDYESGMNRTAADIFEKIFGLNYDIAYSKLHFHVETVDEYGNTDYTRAYMAALTKDTASMISWNSYNSDYLPRHAEEYGFAAYLFV